MNYRVNIFQSIHPSVRLLLKSQCNLIIGTPQRVEVMKLRWHNARPIFDVFSRKVTANSADDNVVIKLPLSDLT